MRRPAVVASAPSRIDLAGGTLDIWPISLLVPGALTVNLAVELRATAQVERRSDRSVRIVSRDRGRELTRKLPLGTETSRGALSLLERVVASFRPARGLRLLTAATAPAGAGLGGSSTLAIAVGAALARWSGTRLGHDALLRRVMNLETIELGVPTGAQDYLAALNGGLAAYHHEPDGIRRERIPIPPGLERRLVLAYTGQPRNSGLSNWEMFRRFIERDRVTKRRMEAIARVARELAAALRAADLDEAGRLVGEEGRLRYRLAPAVGTARLRRVDGAARSAGALGVKVCGAGGGGCLVAFARAGREAAVAEAMDALGARVLPVKIARRGLVVSER